MKPDELGTEQVKALAVAHVRRLEFKVTGSDRRVNHSECERLLVVWRAIRAKVNRSPQWRLLLSDEEKREIQDAVESGEFDDLLRATAERPS